MSMKWHNFYVYFKDAEMAVVRALSKSDAEWRIENRHPAIRKLVSQAKRDGIPYRLLSEKERDALDASAETDPDPDEGPH